MANGYSISLSSIQEAHQRITRFINKTPVMTCSTMNELAGADLFFKVPLTWSFCLFTSFCSANCSRRVALSKPGEPAMLFIHSPQKQHSRVLVLTPVAIMPRCNRLSISNLANCSLQAVAIMAKSRGIKAHVVMVLFCNVLESLSLIFAAQ